MDRDNFKARQKRNAELIRKMKKGESLTSFTTDGSWFPPRPVIKKDKKLVSKLHGLEEIKDGSGPQLVKDNKD